MQQQKLHWSIALIPVMGLSFWFLLGFPFANRNESYLWIAYLEQFSFLEIIENPIPSIRNFRPLAQIVTWLLYHFAGNSGILVQLINFLVLCAAVSVMTSLTDREQSIGYRIAYMLMGFIYIPAFYYIFNLHGIFYSPILLFIACLIKADQKVLTQWKKWLIISVVIAFFHPFMILFYAAFLVGHYIRKEHLNTKQIAILAAIIAILMFFVSLLLPFPVLSLIDVKNLLGSTRNVESSTIISLFTLLLCVIGLIQKPRWQQYFLGGILLAYLPLCWFFNLPLLLLLGILLTINLIHTKNWPLAGLLVVSFSFPLVVGSGAPTKVCMFIFLVPYLLQWQPAFNINLQPVILKTGVAGFIIISSTVGALVLRVGADIPVLSKLVAPVLVEKGKTFQLETILREAQKQREVPHLHFLQEKQANIRDYGQPKKRDLFPPTKQKELNAYQQFLSKEKKTSNNVIWYLSFGEPSAIDTLKLIKTINEKNCKPLYVYETKSR